MATLHIEHAITDLATWMGAFNRFAEARSGAGVRHTRIHQPVDDDRYIYVLGFLRGVVWASPEASPGLAGSPQGRVRRAVTPDSLAQS